MKRPFLILFFFVNGLTAWASDKLTLKPDADLQGDAAPRIKMRPFSIRIELSQQGTQGVLAAHGGQAQGWALIVRDGELRFIVNRDNQRSYLTAKMQSAKIVEASIGSQGMARLMLDGVEVAKKASGGLLTAQPIDGLQIGRDLAAPVGDYAVPFAFDGVISAASLEIGDEVPAPNHLFLGEHLAVRMIPDAVITAMAPHIDAYLAQAVEVSPQRPPEWQVFQRDRWDHEHALLKKPIIVVDWGAVFSLGGAFEFKGATIKPEKEASDEAAQFVLDAFERPYIIGLFLCKLWGNHGNDARFFQDRAARAYLKPDATEFPYRTEALRKANFEAQRRVFDQIK
jgi:hypothetical protein